jgi:hypothetical protein
MAVILKPLFERLHPFRQFSLHHPHEHHALLPRHQSVDLRVCSIILNLQGDHAEMPTRWHHRSLS